LEDADVVALKSKVKNIYFHAVYKACKKNLSLDEFCGKYPRVFGCPCPGDAGTLKLVACEAGMSKN